MTPLHDVFIRIFGFPGLGVAVMRGKGSGAFVAKPPGDHSGRAGRDQVAGFGFPDGVPVAAAVKVWHGQVPHRGSSPFSTQRSR